MVPAYPGPGFSLNGCSSRSSAIYGDLMLVFCGMFEKILRHKYVGICCYVAAKMKALKPVKDEPLTGVKEARYSIYFSSVS